MSATTPERLTEAEAEDRRRVIIETVGGDEDEFRDRAREYLLSAGELALFDELEGLDYLLGR